jgi:restriction system protein
MTIPDYETLMLPVLRACADGQEHRTADLGGQMADLFHLSEEERAALLPSGTQSVIANRTHWTPEERLRSAAAELEATLRSELLERLRDMPPAFFERAVVQLLVAMGYGSDRGGTAAAIGRSGDGGVDGMIDQDPLGLDRVYVQAKRYAADNPVGSPAILQFSGALAQRGAARGVFITTSRFTEDARATAARLPQRIVLIDGEELARLVIRHDVGVRIAETVPVERVDADFFSEE